MQMDEKGNPDENVWKQAEQQEDKGKRQPEQAVFLLYRVLSNKQENECRENNARKTKNDPGQERYFHA
jgi:hypothetical protein